MDVKEIKERKMTLESELALVIATRIQKFKSDTKVGIKNITVYLQEITPIGQQPWHEIRGVEVDLDI